MRRKLSNKGFSLIEIVIVLVVLATLGLGGWYVWHKHHETKTDKSKRTTSTSTSKDSTQQKARSNQQTVVDPYAGWRTYSDSLYGYSFKYPADWKLDVGLVPERDCDAGETAVTSPDGTVTLNYINDNNHDGGIESITPMSVDKLTVQGQDATVIGSYAKASSSYYPSYAVVDTPTTSTYSLTIGQASRFPTPPEFSDQDTGSFTCTGSLIAQPMNPSLSESEAKSWFSTTNAKESLLIIKSLTFNK